MVGWLGGCCCAPTEPQLCDGTYPQNFNEDFEPDFDPDWFYQNPNLIIVNGECQVDPNYIQGSAGNIVYIEKKSIEGEVEVSLTLADFIDSYQHFGDYAVSVQMIAYDTTSSLFITATSARIGLPVGSVFKYYRTTNQFYNFITPQDNDVFGFVMKGFTLTNPGSSIPIVQPSTVEYKVNGSIISTQTQNMPLMLACQMQFRFVITQPFFQQGAIPAWHTQLAVDDFVIRNE